MVLLEFENMQPVLNALGWTLVHFLWQGTLVAGVVRIVIFFLRNREANVRYAAMCIALMLMLLAPVVTFSLVYNEHGNFLGVDETRLIKVEPEFSEANKSGGGLPTVSDAGVNRDSAPVQRNLLSAVINFEAWFPWLVPFWLVGVSVMSARLMVDWFLVRRLAKDAKRQLKELRQMVEGLRRRLGISKPVRLLESSLVKVPVAVGWLKPMILLPVGMALSLTPQQLESIIAHELAHVRRHDYLVNILQSVAEILLFYHPAVLWLSKQIRIEREYACDDLAIKACGGDPLRYARALTKVERIRRGAPPPAALAAAAVTGGSLESRVRRLVDVSYSHPAGATSFTGGLILSTVLAASVAGWHTAFSGKFENSPPQDEAFLPPKTEPSELRAAGSNAETSTATAPAATGVEGFSGEDEILRKIALSALGSHHGSVIIMNPNTGRLYTIVNQELAFREEWNPASTFKIVTSLAALNENKVKADEKIPVRGSSENLTLDDSIAASRYEYFDAIGERVGAEKILAYARDLGLGRRTGVNLPDEAAGYLPQTAPAVDAGELGVYGQDVKVTPMQLAVMISALANKGVIVVPFAGKAENPPRVLRPVKVSHALVSQLVNGMQLVVEKGTGKGAFNPYFAVAGKTGTAETGDDGIGLFASFAPIDNPRFVVVVALKEPKATGLVAAEIAGNIYRSLGSVEHRLKN